MVENPNHSLLFLIEKTTY